MKTDFELLSDSEHIGKEYGALRVLTASFLLLSNSGDRRIKYTFVVCACGKVFRVQVANLKNNSSLQCKECAVKALQKAGSKALTTHSLSRSIEYNTWAAMLYRCGYNDTGYVHENYFGVAVCNRWLESFENFYEDMGPRPEGRFSIDRVDSEGDYCPENCRWITLNENVARANHSRKV